MWFVLMHRESTFTSLDQFRRFLIAVGSCEHGEETKIGRNDERKMPRVIDALDHMSIACDGTIDVGRLKTQPLKHVHADSIRIGADALPPVSLHQCAQLFE